MQFKDAGFSDPAGLHAGEKLAGHFSADASRLKPFGAWTKTPGNLSFEYAHNIQFLNAGSTDKNALDYVIGQIQDGARVIESGEDSAIIGREFTKRKMPV